MLGVEIDKAVEASPEFQKLREEAGDNKRRQTALTNVVGWLKSTAIKQADGRIAQINAAGKGDIMEDLPDIVKDVFTSNDPTELLATVTPQPDIIFGASEPGEAPITILSDDAKTDLRTDDPNFLDNEVQLIGKALAENSELSGAKL